jgi:hypothetical protein
MSSYDYRSVILTILMVLIFLSVIVTFILVVRLPTIRLKTKAASIGVTANALLITVYYILKFLIW